MAYSNVVNVSFTTLSSEVILSANDLVSASAVDQAGVVVDVQLQAESLSNGSAAQSGAVAVHALLQAESLSNDSAIDQAAVLVDAQLQAESLTSSSAVETGAVVTTAALVAASLTSSSAVETGAVITTAALVAASLTSSSAIQSEALSISYGITDVYAEVSGEAPIYWLEPAVAEGNFGPNEGLVYVHTSRATVISWTANRIEFTPVPNGLPAGTYDVHVDRVL